MYPNTYILPNDISTTDEEIRKQISSTRNKEWKSKKEVYTFLQNNSLQEWRIIGWISKSTTKKWENWAIGPLYLIAKGVEWKYVYSLGVAPQKNF